MQDVREGPHIATVIQLPNCVGPDLPWIHGSHDGTNKIVDADHRWSVRGLPDSHPLKLSKDFTPEDNTVLLHLSGDIVIRELQAESEDESKVMLYIPLKT